MRSQSSMPILLRRRTQRIGRVELPNTGDELHHFGWNACSAALCPFAPHPHVERRYLIVPGLRSSRIYIVDTKPDPAQAAHRKHHRAGRDLAQDRIHAAAHGALRARRDLHSALGNADGEVRAASSCWIAIRSNHRAVGNRSRPAIPRVRLLVAPHARRDGDERVGHAEYDRGRPGPELLPDGKYGHQLHFWDLRKRSHVQASTSAPSSRWCSNCGRRTIRRTPTDSSASSFR